MKLSKEMKATKHHLGVELKFEVLRQRAATNNVEACTKALKEAKDMDATKQYLKTALDIALFSKGASVKNIGTYTKALKEIEVYEKKGGK